MTTENPDGPMWTALWERLSETITDIRDESPRTPDDADSGEIASALVPIVAAAMGAELRAQSARLLQRADVYRVNGETERAAAVSVVAGELSVRATELDGAR